MAKSSTGYILRYLSLKYLGKEHADPTPGPGDMLNPSPAVASEAGAHGPAADEVQASLFEAEPTETPGPALVGTTVEAFMAVGGSSTGARATFQNQEDAPACPNCGSIMVRAGAFYSCPNCGNTSGCG